MSEVTIRRAKASEVHRAGEIAVRAYLSAGLLSEASDYGRHLQDAASRAEHAELLVAVDGDAVVLGSVTVARYGTRFAQVAREGELEFRMLSIDPGAQGRGIGAMLTQAVLDRGSELGTSKVVLCLDEENFTARRLYERFGFQRLPERDWSPVPGLTLLAFGIDL